MEKDLIPIGKVVKPHGVKGKVKVEYFGESLAHFSYREILIEDRTGKLKTYEVSEVASQPPRLILRLKGIEKIEDVEPFLGKEILVRKELLPGLEEGEYYWYEILGMVVETVEGKTIGKVREILPTGANDVYVIEGKRGEIFLPAIEDVIQGIDRERRVMKVIRKEGLWGEEDEI
jgi:16S rRNA processing protein RimM